MCFQKKAGQICVESKSILCYNINIVETIDQKEKRDAAVT